MFFKSAVDAWVYALAITLPIATLRIVVPLVTRGTHATLVMLAIAGLTPMVVIPLWLLMATYYRVDAVMLRVQAGPFSYSIPIEQIRAVSAAYSWTLAPALSCRRLKLEYGRGRTLLISPKKRAEFIKAIGFSPVEQDGRPNSLTAPSAGQS